MPANSIAGLYTATWNSLACGQSADGFRLSHSFFKQLVTGDLYGQAPQDAIYQGAELSAQFRLIEYNAAAIATIMWPYSATLLSMGVVGRMDVNSSLAKPLVLTAVAGTPAATSPATRTMPLAILAEGFPVELLYAPALREIPIKQRIYPNSSGVFGTET